MHKKQLRIILIIFVLLWMGVIYFFSDMPGISSTNKSVKILDNTITTTINVGNSTGIVKSNMNKRSINKVAKKLNYPFRKIMHICEYFVLMILLLNLLYSFDIYKIKKYIFSFIICFLYACSDEYHQLFVKRTSSFSDVLIDAIGIVIAIIVYYFIFNKYNKKIKESI